MSAESYSEPYQSSKAERFAKIVHGLKPLTIFEKRSEMFDWSLNTACVGISYRFLLL